MSMILLCPFGRQRHRNTNLTESFPNILSICLHQSNSSPLISNFPKRQCPQHIKGINTQIVWLYPQNKHFPWSIQFALRQELKLRTLQYCCLPDWEILNPNLSNCYVRHSFPKSPCQLNWNQVCWININS